MTEATNNPQPATSEKDVSLGPACMVVVIFGLVGLCIVFAFMSLMLMNKQGEMAENGLRQQLIPWVEEKSLLSQGDREVIISKLDELANMASRDELTKRQISRLGIRLTQSTILQWGAVESLNRMAQSSGLSDDEKTQFARACDRWLSSAASGRLNMHDMEFATQRVCEKDPKAGTLMPRENLTDEELRDFMRRVKTMCDKHQIPDEEFHKSVSQVFLQVVEDGLAEK